MYQIILSKLRLDKRRKRCDVLLIDNYDQTKSCMTKMEGADQDRKDGGVQRTVSGQFGQGCIPSRKRGKCMQGL